ncbi:MAG: hypothetical protein WA775_03350 [Psychroserpens sp.]|uniref:hypothetical protein n=1 Tax=Psychroserpens sp. TaxID=2020870 RepID=UPI003C98ABE1
MKITTQLFGLLFITSLLIGCSPEDGRDGTDGIDGINGSEGPQGETGTANVIYSDWILNDFPSGGGLLQKLFTLASADEINSLNINLNTSAVMVYGRGNILLEIGDEVLPLPYITGAGARYSFTIKDDGRILAVGQTSNVADNDFTVFDDYRYIIIPGGNPVNSNRNSNSKSADSKSSALDYTTMTYEELITHFNIPD